MTSMGGADLTSLLPTGISCGILSFPLLWGWGGDGRGERASVAGVLSFSCVQQTSQILSWSQLGLISPHMMVKQEKFGTVVFNVSRGLFLSPCSCV